MTDRNEIVRLAIYTALAHTGRMPSAPELAEETGLERPDVDEAMEELAAGRHLVFDDRHEVVLAHPFATRNFAFSVMGDHTLWWGGCAWDAFAIPNLVLEEPVTLVATTCPACGTAHSWSDPGGTAGWHAGRPLPDADGARVGRRHPYVREPADLLQ